MLNEWNPLKHKHASMTTDNVNAGNVQQKLLKPFQMTEINIIVICIWGFLREKAYKLRPAYLMGLMKN